MANESKIQMNKMINDIMLDVHQRCLEINKIIESEERINFDMCDYINEIEEYLNVAKKMIKELDQIPSKLFEKVVREFDHTKSGLMNKLDNDKFLD